VLISIITINFNDVVGLQRTILSVLEQTYTNIEYIVIDGGSTDGSKEYIEAHQESLAYWVSEPDTGIYNAMNKGIDAATGDYLLFLNSGDYLYSKNVLSYFQDFLVSSPDNDIYYGKIKVVGEKQWIKEYPNTLSFSYFVKDTIPHPATLIKRSCFKDFKYDELLKIVSDWKFFIIGICKLNFSYQYYDEVIATFGLDGISSYNSDLVNKERKEVLLKEFPLFMKDHDNCKKIKHQLKLSKQKTKLEQILQKIYRKIIK